MSIDPLYQDICENIESDSYLTPKTCGLMGGIISTPIGIILAPFVVTSVTAVLLVKGVTMAAGSGLGWKLGNDFYGGNEIIIALMHQPDAWKRLHNGYKTSEPNQEYQEDAIEDKLLDTRYSFGKLYRFATFLFAERYEQLYLNHQPKTESTDMVTTDKHILRELNCLVDMMALKHPMYTRENFDTIRMVIEQRAMDDLYSYIHGHYIMETKKKNQNITPLLLIESRKNKLTPSTKKLTQHEKLVHRASLQFRHLPHVHHPKEKAAILVNMVKDIDNDLKEQGITLCCDDLIPIVSEIIMCNLDILPSAEIQLVFDYLEKSFDEDAYVATVVLSSLQVCYRNLRNRCNLSLTPPCQTESPLKKVEGGLIQSKSSPSLC